MKNILLIDDSSLVLLSLKMTLEAAHYRVDVCHDGQEAIDKISAGMRPDMVITDLNMPRIGGIDFIRAVRGTLRFTPIVIITTESQLAKKDEAKQAGATGWLTKPVKPENLLSVVNKVMPQAA